MSSQGNSERLQDLVLDIMANTLKYASKEPGSSPLEPLAKGLGRSFHPCKVRVYWKTANSEHFGCCYWDSRRVKTDVSTKRPGRDLVPTVKTQRGSLTLTYLDSRDQLARGFTVSEQSSSPMGYAIGGELWVALSATSTKGRSELSHRVAEFRKYISGLRILYSGFKALHAASEPSQPVELTQHVAELTANTGAPFLERLEKAEETIQSIDSKWQSTHQGIREGYLDLITRLAEAVMLEMLGTGWDVENLEGQRGGARIREFISRLRPYIGRLEDGEELAATITIMQAVSNAGLKDEAARRPTPPSTLDGTTKSRKAIAGALMARWTRIHQMSRRLAASSEAEANEEDDRDFLVEVNQSIGPIASFLRGRVRQGSEAGNGLDSDGFKTSYLPSWLQLWFCHALMVDLREGTSAANHRQSAARRKPTELSLSRAQLWRFRADLAYVIRESLRFFAYNKSPHLFFQPAVHAAALRTLVEYHAIWVLKLPRELDIRGLLREIGRLGSGSGPHSSSGHQAHVLEMYIGGQFLCELQVDFEADSEASSEDRPCESGYWTLGDILAGRSAWRPGTLKAGEFRKAFGLAVLLHDVGMLLFPKWTQRHERLVEVETTLGKNLRSIRQTLNTTASKLLQICERELREEGYFDPTSEPRLASWIRSIIERGVPDHSLLGAWYLHRIGQDVEGLSSDLMQQAVRAVLLHSIVTQKIRVDDDPVAALLVLCDTVFMWQQAGEDPQPDESGRFLSAIAGEVRPQNSPFHSLWLHGLRLREPLVPSSPDGVPSESGQNAEKRSPPAATPDSETSEREQSSRDPTAQPLRAVLSISRESKLKTRQGGIWPYFEITLKDPDYLRVPVYFIWLSVAQNLGRIEASRWGCGPALRIHSKISGRMEQAGLDTHRLLELAANQTRLGLRPSLERWLGRRDVFGSLLDKSSKSKQRAWDETSTGDPPPFESVNILPLRNFYNQDIAGLFPEIQQIVEAVSHEEMLRHQVPPSRAAPLGTKGKP